MELLSGERQIFSLDARSPELRLFSSDRVILTTHRVRYETKRIGYVQITSILLEQLASVQVTQTSNPILLVLALIVFAIGLFAIPAGSSNIPVFAAIALSLLLVIAYYISRREVLVLTASGATIKIALRRIGAQLTKRFIDNIEAAKNTRYLIGKP